MKTPFIEKADQLILAEDFMEIYIPKFYFESDIAYFIGREIMCYGIFNFRYFTKEEYSSELKKKKVELHTFALPVIIALNPNDYSNDLVPEIDEEEKVMVLKFSKNEVVIKTTELVIQQVETFTKFLSLLTSGRLPKTIPYLAVSDIALSLQTFNKRDLGIPSLGYEMIVSDIYRDKTDLSKSFRFKMGSKPNVNQLDYTTLNLRELANENSEYTGLTFEDFLYAVQSAIVKTQNGHISKESPVEKTIKY